MSKTEAQPMQASKDTELSPLNLIEKIIDIFAWIVKAFVYIGVGSIIVFVVVIIVILVALLTGHLSGDIIAPFFAGSKFQPTEIFASMFDSVTNLAGKIWDFLAPVLQFVIVVVLLRWLLLPPQGRLSSQLRNIVKDVPAAIAILVVGTLCLITVLGKSVPEALSNVALVIVGFYFGQERLKKVLSEEEKEIDRSGETGASVQEGTSNAT